MTWTPPGFSQTRCSARNRPWKCVHVKHPAARACVATGYGVKVRVASCVGYAAAPMIRSSAFGFRSQKAQLCTMLLRAVV
jgi:hypothetical protein